MKFMYGILFLMFISLSGVAATVNTSTNKSFTVAAQTNAACCPLIGSAAMMYTNSPFSIVGTNGFYLNPSESMDIVIRFAPAVVGKFTNYVVFTSNGGNSTNMVTGTGVMAVNGIKGLRVIAIMP